MTNDEARQKLLDIAKANDWYMILHTGHFYDAFIVAKGDKEPGFYHAIYEQVYDVLKTDEVIRRFRVNDCIDKSDDVDYVTILERLNEQLSWMTVKELIVKLNVALEKGELDTCSIVVKNLDEFNEFYPVRKSAQISYNLRDHEIPDCDAELQYIKENYTGDALKAKQHRIDKIEAKKTLYKKLSLNGTVAYIQD